MCIRPMEKDGQTFACRNCDQCIAVRKADWVSRAVAEQAVSPYTFIVTLTYNDETEHSRDSAAMFRYSDVAAWLKRLRRAVEYKVKSEQLNASPVIRFICAGEQGSRNGRCHWHIILYSHVDLTQIGTFTDANGEVVAPDNVVSRGRSQRRLSWQHWPHGFVLVQEPNEGGMAYVLKYCIKNQFDVEKSKGNARFRQSEVYATGVFRMSKYPPIGLTYIQQLLQEMRDKGFCPPKLTFKIKGQRGYWWPSGQLRKLMLATIGEINQEYFEKHGSPLPQWSTLLHTLRDNPSDLEALLDGTEEEQDDENQEDFGESIQRRSRWEDGERERSKITRRCGSTLPCSLCLGSISERERRSLGVVETSTPNEADPQLKTYRYTRPDGADISHLQEDGAGGGLHRLCQLSEAPSVKKTFGRSA